MSKSIQTKSFHIGDILSVIDGHLVSPRHINGVYDILGWMTGESLMTHSLPRASDECEGNLRAQHPDLAAVVVPDGLRTEEAVLAWLETQVALFGETRDVAPLDVEDHTVIDPIAELRMIRPNALIVGVDL